MTGAIIALVAGLAILILSSDRLVVSAVRLSRAWGVSAVLVGAVVVGFGTSLPEMLVSALASLNGELDVAFANIVGSNIANVTLVLGAAALAAPIVAWLTLLRREGVLMLSGLVLLTAFAIDLRIDRFEGIVLLLAVFGAMYLLIYWSRADASAEAAVGAEVEDLVGELVYPWWIELGIGILTLGLTVAGANLLLTGALSIAEEVGLSDTFLGLILGVGTSLPELATALASTRRGQTDLVVGNVLGSNLFNSLAVAGIAGTIAPGALASDFRWTLWFMIGSSVVAAVFALSGRRIVRQEALLLLVIFISFAALSY